MALFNKNHQMMSVITGNSKGIYLVQCPLCGETVHVVTSIHLERVHNMSIDDFIKLNKNYVGLTGMNQYLGAKKAKRKYTSKEYHKKYYQKNRERELERARTNRLHKKEIRALNK